MRLPAECQVLVAGAGAAGVLAAVAAARQGADTLLVEPAARPGGVGRSQFHRHLCGLYINGEAGPGPLLHGALVAEVVDRLQQRSGIRAPQRMGRTWVWPLRDGDLDQVLHDLCLSATRLRVEYGAQVDALALDPVTGRPRFEVIQHSRRQTGAARTAVDATGHAGLAALAGWRREESPADDRQLAGYTIQMEQVETADSLQALRVPLALRRACDSGELADTARHTVFIPTGEHSALLRLNVPFDTTPDHVEQLARVVLEKLRRAGLGLDQATVTAVSGLEPRDRGRVVGHYRLRAEDVLGSCRFPDAVARGAWPMECWRPGRSPSLQYGPDGESYDIPLRGMLSPECDFVFFAGRSLSCDADAFGSIRVMGTCMATGEAAGREAALRSA